MARLSRFAPNRQRRRGSSAGLFSPCGLKTLNLQGRSPRLRPEPPAAVRGYDRLIGPKSQTWGLQKLCPMPPFGGPGLRRAYFRPVDSKRSTYRGADAPPPQAYSLRLRPEPPPAARGFDRLIFVLWAQNARPSGAALPSRAYTPPLWIAAEGGSTSGKPPCAQTVRRGARRFGRYARTALSSAERRLASFSSGETKSVCWWV